MIPVSLQIRPAELADHQQIANLIFFEARVHRHLDWRTPLDWLGSPHYWIMEDQGHVTAALACPQDPPGVAWIRLFAFVARLAGPEAWLPLWETARAEFDQMGNSALIAAIAIKPWFQNILQVSGLVKHQDIVLLEWIDRSVNLHPIPFGISIRPMLADDLPIVAQTDSAAFEPLWRNSYDALQKAYSQAICATVAEKAGMVIGYQLSTGNSLGAHLARLAVWPEAQGGGIGAALVGDLILRLRRQNLARLSVNTQMDNSASLALYQKLGFVRTGEQYPVYVYPIGVG